MSVYIYKAKKSPTEIISGEIEARSREEVVAKLEGIGLVPVKILEKITGDNQRLLDLDGKSSVINKKEPVKRIRRKDIDSFTWQLACLIKTSVPILGALRLICQQTENKELKKLVDDLELQIKNGRMLSEALMNYPHVFNNLYISMLKFGEKSGSLSEVLYKIAQYREEEEEIRRKIQAAIAYPLFLIVFGIVTIFVMLTFLLPRFIGLFDQLNQSLPLPTAILINTSKFMAGNKYWLLFGAVSLFVMFGMARPGSKKKFVIDLVKIRLPFVRDFVRSVEVARFSRTLAMLLKNGISVYESMALATDTLDNDLLKSRLRQAQKEIINRGYSLSAALNDIHVFPAFTINMIAVGDESGKLEESLNEIADVYEKDIEQKTKIIMSLLEPLIILVIGLVVGFIVFAMLLPILNINAVIK